MATISWRMFKIDKKFKKKNTGDKYMAFEKSVIHSNVNIKKSLVKILILNRKVR